MNMMAHPIHVRSHLDFHLDDVPKYWFGGNVYATRFMDSICMLFPVGERSFISSIRPYRDQITDPELAQAAADFCMQEGQHGIQHSLYNEILIKQGTPAQEIIQQFSAWLEHRQMSQKQDLRLAITAALEHMTALMAEALFRSPDTMASAHPNMRALLAWHAIEEMEHRAVAFDVLTKVVKISYQKRILAMSIIFPQFWRNALVHTDKMLAGDGFNRLQRLNMARKTLPLFFGRHGIMTRVLPEFRQYFRPDFHPNDIPMLKQYPRWLEVYERTGSPLKAAEMMYVD